MFGLGFQRIARRAGGAAWSPADMATPPVAWYEAADGDLAADLSGNGYNLAGTAPTYVAAAPSGATVARFNGVDQYLRDTFTLAQPYYIVTVSNYSRVKDSGTLVDGSVANNTGRLFITVSGLSTPETTIAAFAAGSFFYYDGVGGTPKDTSLWRRTEMLFDGASSEGLLTGPGGGSATGNPGTAGPGGITIGANAGRTSFADCDVGAVLLFASEPSAQDLTDLRTYLDEKYGT